MEFKPDDRVGIKSAEGAGEKFIGRIGTIRGISTLAYRMVDGKLVETNGGEWFIDIDDYGLISIAAKNLQLVNGL